MELARPLEEIPFVALDVETTGLEPQEDRIVEVALVLFRMGREEGRWQRLIDPGRPIPPEVTRIHGITDRHVAGALPFAALAPDLLRRLAGRIPVAHNAPFDLAFLQAELGRAGLRWAPDAVVDTLQIARRRYRFPRNDLTTLARTLGLRVPAHRALEDALTTRALLERFLEDLRRQGGRTLGDLLLWQGTPLSPTPRLGPPSPGELWEILYQSWSGRLSRRRIRIEAVEERRGTLYVVAFCLLREERRTFRWDRVLKGERMEGPPGPA